MMRETRAVRIYAVLLVLYPRSHRDEYGSDMVQLFADRYRDERPTVDLFQFVRFWGGMIGDIFKTVLAERTESVMSNFKQNWWKWAIGVVAGFQTVFAVEAVVGLAAGWQEPQVHPTDVHLIDALIPITGAVVLIVGLKLLSSQPRIAAVLLTVGLLPVALVGVIFFWFPPMWLVSVIGIYLIVKVYMEAGRITRQTPAIAT
jgi:hypothetical protein